ncbi:hypothetical protein HD554DRAFT_2045351 [Boletus coccyginus]|nr:hypothetical protein HD554DRAFT_2045351 [Boletus coccyginus]
MGIGSDAPLSLSGGCSDNFTQALSPGHMPATNMDPRSRTTLHTQPIWDLGSGSGDSTMYHHANLGTNLDHSLSHTTDALVSSPLSGSTKGSTDFANSEMQPLLVIYSPPDKKGSAPRRSRRACAINIDELWVDKDDLHSDTGHSSGIISIYKCQWSMSGDPCGMWIIGSRSRVGAHIRRWHAGRRHADTTSKCLWEGCAKTMLKDSINRHIVTVHLGEGFHCQGCDQEFSRKDVYNQHVEDCEACRGAVATMVYSVECKVIDTRQALHRGGAIRYAGR